MLTLGYATPTLAQKSRQQLEEEKKENAGRSRVSRAF